MLYSTSTSTSSWGDSYSENSSFYENEEVLLDKEQGFFYKKISDRMINQRVLEDLVVPSTGEVILKAGGKFNRLALRKLSESGVDILKINDDEVIDGILGGVQPSVFPNKLINCRITSSSQSGLN